MVHASARAAAGRAGTPALISRTTPLSVALAASPALLERSAASVSARVLVTRLAVRVRVASTSTPPTRAAGRVDARAPRGRIARSGAASAGRAASVSATRWGDAWTPRPTPRTAETATGTAPRTRPAPRRFAPATLPMRRLAGPPAWICGPRPSTVARVTGLVALRRHAATGPVCAGRRRAPRFGSRPRRTHCRSGADSRPAMESSRSSTSIGG